MKHLIKNSSWIVITVLLLIFAVSSPGQKRFDRPFPPIFIEDPGYPIDYTNEFYEINGIDVSQVLNRRTGADGLSVPWTSNNPHHNLVRVLVTLPAYDNDGRMMFWYPLGDMTERAFLNDKNGFEARRMAEGFPIYVFPDKRIASFTGFRDARQAPLMDVVFEPAKGLNPLGLRELMIVRFTAKAFSGEGADLMNYMAKKNGFAIDDTPILKTLADVIWMQKEAMVSVEATGYFPSAPYEGQYAIAPVIQNPRYGVIAPDAFLMLPLKDGNPLPAEMPFMTEFLCLQRTGNWCMGK